MKTISVTDLKLIPELSHLRDIDFIDPANTELIKPFLKVLGFDLDYPVEFIPSQHRNLQNKVVISYQIVGEVECNAAFLTSQWATAEDRMIAAGYRDLGLAKDLASSSTIGRNYGGSDNEAVLEALAPDMLNPDEQEIAAQIQTLKDLLLIVRGNPYKADGSLATLCEHGKVDEVASVPTNIAK
jgi:hypothetical protein